MASWRVIEHTGHTLVQLLKTHINRAISNVNVQLISTASFNLLNDTDTATISLFLYQINENAELRNAPQRVDTQGKLRRQPLALELCYMVTPWASRADNEPLTDTVAVQEEQRLMGLVMQAFYDGAELGPADLYQEPVTPVWTPMDSLQISLETLPIEDHYRIWDAAQLPYRLSVTYRVRVMGLDSTRVHGEARVEESTFHARPNS